LPAGAVPSSNLLAKARANASTPLVFLLHVGYKSYASPDDALLECWETMDNFYSAGELIYLGWVVANFEDVRKKLAYWLK
jgi:hypothetical protein